MPPKFSLTHDLGPMLALAGKTDHRTLAIWAADCVERVMPYFKEKYPEDPRPRNAIEALREWIRSGTFRMAEIRKASLDAHAAAREAGGDDAARSAARAAGQAVATAHVPTHAVAAAGYALQAVYRATDPSLADAAVAGERDWQYRHLLRLKEKNRPPDSGGRRKRRG
jgi:Imm-5 like putative immunity protein